MVRNDSSYKHHINVFIKDIVQKEAHHQIRRENEEEIAQSFKLALKVTLKDKAYEKRLLKRELDAVIKYKQDLKERHIPDFAAICEILDKIPWFHKFPFRER